MRTGKFSAATKRLFFKSNLKPAEKFRRFSFPTPLVLPDCLRAKGERLVNDFAEDVEAFRAARKAAQANARQNAAFFLMCGIDLDEALAAGEAERARILSRLERLMERERQKGLRRHWSYDLNRHIALKQAANRLKASGGHVNDRSTNDHRGSSRREGKR